MICRCFKKLSFFFNYFSLDTYMKTDREWLLDPGLSNRGMKCNFDGHHMATRTSQDEITHTMLFGRGRTSNTDFHFFFF